MIIPETITPRELADKMGWSERAVREIARALGACLGSGKGMRLTQADVIDIMEAKRPCHSKSRNAVKSGITAGPLPAGDYAALRALRTKKPPKGSPPRLPAPSERSLRATNGVESPMPRLKVGPSAFVQ